MSRTLVDVAILLLIVFGLLFVARWKWFLALPKIGVVGGSLSALLLGAILLAVMFYLLAQNGFVFFRR